MDDWKLKNECEICGMSFVEPEPFGMILECGNCGAEYEIEWDDGHNEDSENDSSPYWWMKGRDKDVFIRCCYVDYREMRKNIDKVIDGMPKDKAPDVRKIVSGVMKEMMGKVNLQVLVQEIADYKGYTMDKKYNTVQDYNPNFRDEDGKLFLVRCKVCDRENYLPAVASGICVWCGWTEKDKMDK